MLYANTYDYTRNRKFIFFAKAPKKVWNAIKPRWKVTHHGFSWENQITKQDMGNFYLLRFELYPTQQVGWVQD